MTRARRLLLFRFHLSRCAVCPCGCLAHAFLHAVVTFLAADNPLYDDDYAGVTPDLPEETTTSASGSGSAASTSGSASASAGSASAAGSGSEYVAPTTGSSSGSGSAVSSDVGSVASTVDDYSNTTSNDVYYPPPEIYHDNGTLPDDGNSTDYYHFEGGNDTTTGSDGDAGTTDDYHQGSGELNDDVAYYGGVDACTPSTLRCSDPIAFSTRVSSPGYPHACHVPTPVA